MTPTNRARVRHVGRIGEAPGGMTQVINGYLAGDFARVDVGAIVSRDAPGSLKSVPLALLAACRVAALASSRRPQVLVFHLSQRGSFLREGGLLLLAKRLGIPAIAHLHGSSFVEFASRSPRLAGRVLRSATKVFSLSASTSQAVIDLGVPSDRVALVPNVVSSGMNNLPKQRLVVFAGAVSRRKGIDVLMAAWQRVRPPNWTLIIAGPDVDGFTVELESLEEFGVRYVGAQSHEAVMNYLEASAVAVLPSRDEAMPMFLLEAMARKNFIVATNVGGIPTIVPRPEQRLVSPGDVDALETQLRAATQDLSRTTGWGEQDYVSFLADFSAEVRLPQIESLWLEAASSRESPGAALLTKRSKRT